MNKLKLFFSFGLLVYLCACGDYFKNDYNDTSPTSGKLKILCTEGLELHIQNQAYGFSSEYPRAHIETSLATESEAIDLFLKDSCKAIIINRRLGENEQRSFEQKKLNPAFSPIAKTGVALITNISSSIHALTVEEIKKLLSSELILKDSLGNEISPNVVLDNKNSSVSHYLLDSLLQAKQFGPKCFAMENSLDLIKKIAESKDQIGFIDFAWLSDKDDSLFKLYDGKIKFIAVGRTDTIFFEPNQSSFKTGEYPFTRTVYIYRRNDDFSLAKGFEAYIAGPKGQVTFLKQGLLPNRQPERTIEIKTQ